MTSSQREQVRQLFKQGLWPIRAIALHVGVSEKTVQRLALEEFSLEFRHARHANMNRHDQPFEFSEIPSPEQLRKRDAIRSAANKKVFALNVEYRKQLSELRKRAPTAADLRNARIHQANAAKKLLREKNKAERDRLRALANMEG